ncbi:hypothetical protein HH800_02405 [Sphingobium yanoikuyae]|uniref:Uncharacterized protein n=1 Tax=Sphingobium yanoikuyae TaxID=13690 RepID=A0A6M4G2P6_SPHYA|nr:hypothetical protein [Sphingobium yanoikuyae]QJR01150.1 hypothetical protein HH800_02405 [Sphingobium yanoikuyae]
MTRQKEAITVASARAQLKAMLANARSLDHLTVEQLVRSYRVPPREIEYELTVARQKRGAA